ncbi:magnesium-translocating P-type ATPase [Nocardia arthritidis]|uniref:Magnesium-transporting ATPase, P-type 1 n=1 Tax=Nocardia arthritidis TaxID=228602 RepID=A0A6G9YH22_9NOCA|nr:magnesium-translocating P-type ATPase [Nocardia arthritidis]QIS12539.1 magnesium-translocating P-type ATPase [Nocardia arthritidis]
MQTLVEIRAAAPGGPRPLSARAAGAMTTDQVLSALAAPADGLSENERVRRRQLFGPNAIRTHKTRLLPVLLRQLRSPLLLLLAVTAAVSFFVGERTDAIIIGVILAASVGLGLINEYRAERAADALHERIRHRAVILRGGTPESVDLAELVPGDVVELRAGELVPADLRLLSVTGLRCDESVLTGESAPVSKSVAPVAPESPVAELVSCALMGTVVSAGRGRGLVTATGTTTEFGRIAAGLSERQPETEFQIGLRKFSMLLVWVAAALTTGIFAVNLVLQRPLLDALLFSLAIAVGISPQLLPAVVSTALAAGSRQLANCKVLVKRLVCIEDLGDIEVLFTDKTGTLTEGRIEYMRALDPDGGADGRTRLLGMLCTDGVISGETLSAADPLDTALWASPGAPTATVAKYRRLATLPFDHERRLLSVLVSDDRGEPSIITKGAPEAVLARCPRIPAAAQAVLDAEFAAGHRIVAVATRRADPAATALEPADERDLTLCGFLVFLDPPKSSAREALSRLSGLGVTVKILTGDNPAGALHVCRELGLPAEAAVTGTDLDRLDDRQLAECVKTTTVFARVSPEQKARIVRSQRAGGLDVAFLGDGVNDALALHAADVGISVDSATDVAKDAADVVLLEKDLGVLADGVVAGRRIFANTMKYVLMGTSSNFGNMFSAAGASAFLPFLPMLPSQILLNNLLYDSSQLAIPTDHVDEEQLARPARWNIGLIRRFMLIFGPISSAFDFATFGVMLWLFHADETLFHTGWFVESLATQTLVLFVIRTRRSPFFRSGPSTPLLLAACTAVAVGALLPVTPLAADLGFRPLPGAFLLVVVLLIITYLGLAELAKRWFFRTPPSVATQRERTKGYRIRRRAARFNAKAPRNRRPGHNHR